jgi:hypothetical protein
MASPLRLAGRARAVQWRVVLGVAVRLAQEGRRRWGRLTPREQRELTRIVRKSRGRPGNVTPGERAELRRIVWKAAGPRR